MRWAMNQITLHGGSRQAPDDLAGDLTALRAGGWRAVEAWLPQWDGYLERHGLAAARPLLDGSGLQTAGGCGLGDGGSLFFSQGEALERVHDALARRLEQCAALSKTEDLELLRREPGRLFFVHVSDVDAVTPRDLWTVPDRTLPGSGGVPNAMLLERIRGLGYDEDLSLELFNAEFETRWCDDPVAAGRLAYARCTALVPDQALR